MTEEATNKARIYINKTNVEHVEEIALSVEDKDVPSKELMENLIEVAKKYEGENGKETKD